MIVSGDNSLAVGESRYRHFYEPSAGYAGRMGFWYFAEFDKP
jgi:hypothetical protein